ncbi:hypothetical protein [Puniceibacterium antarcticum]|nr:hypothetical protein [Puniceibacterium antarcticum]
MKFTLDTNCIIDVAEKRSMAVHVLSLLATAKKGAVEVALVASSASERQEGDGYLSSLNTFDERRNALGFGNLPLLPSIGRFDISFFDHCLMGSDETIAVEHSIYRALFPNSPPEWTEYAAAKGYEGDDLTSKGYARWRNQLLDVQAFWAHRHAGYDVFVTSDKRFRVLEGHNDFPEAVVRNPEEAVKLIEGSAFSVTGA